MCKNKVNQFTGEILKFTCMICGKWRLDKFISVETRPFLYLEGVVIGEENIRYCNDNKECIEGLTTYNGMEIKGRT